MSAMSSRQRGVVPAACGVARATCTASSIVAHALACSVWRSSLMRLSIRAAASLNQRYFTSYSAMPTGSRAASHRRAVRCRTERGASHLRGVQQRAWIGGIGSMRCTAKASASLAPRRRAGIVVQAFTCLRMLRRALFDGRCWAEGAEEQRMPIITAWR